MKSFARMFLLAAVAAGPAASFAQPSADQPTSRAQVREELAQLEKAGYDPHDWVHYPENIQAAQARVATQNATAQGAGSAFGGASDGASRSGAANGF
ncbi:DUF4148 domain-containing protein [Caballeronia ptereochthonis]|uniref:Membrane protein n=1 Tax=Caballeronia ptereochthonis TaxID=1777144 RepID=A0A158AVY9_9BURK|nr:DUF4148 domain-containing protein [Caballeronia ptereochthonis]SAK61982.1 membrane protein [Caballeronia ptereochthonis]